MNISKETPLRDLCKKDMLPANIWQFLGQLNVQTLDDLACFICEEPDILLKVSAIGKKKQQAILRALISLTERAGINTPDRYPGPLRREFLEQTYHAMARAQLNTRAMHYVEDYYPTAASAIDVAEMSSLEFFHVAPHKLGKHSSNFFHSFVLQFLERYDEILSLPLGKVLQQKLQYEFPFLRQAELPQLAQFWQNRNHRPMFYILNRFLSVSEDTYDQIYARLYGFGGYIRQPKEELAPVFNLTSERIRQISNKCHSRELLQLLQHPDWQHYSALFQAPYLSEHSPEFQTLQEEEGLPRDFFTFAATIALHNRASVMDTDFVNFLISRRLLHHINILQYLHYVQSNFHVRRYEDVVLNISLLTANVPDELKSTADQVARQLTYDAFKLTPDTDGYFIIPKNSVEVSTIVVDILNRRRTFMSYQQVFSDFMAMYPDEDPKMTLSRVRTALTTNPHIHFYRSLGYALDTWDPVPSSSITAYLQKMLQESPAPIPVAELTAATLQVYHTTNAKSIASILVQGSAKGFVPYEGDRYGLAGKSYPEEYRIAELTRPRTYDESLHLYCKFISKNKRLPSHRGDKEERRLERWYANKWTHADEGQCQKLLQTLRTHLPESPRIRQLELLAAKKAQSHA